MKQPITHQSRHPSWGHKWDPYGYRDYTAHLLDKTTFDTLCAWEPKDYISPELFSHGCLDAPNDIPLGGTASILTIGGYWREEYLTLGRDWESYAAYERASAETAVMIKEILDEVEK